MSGGIEWRGDMVSNLRTILAKTQRLDDDLAVGAKEVLAEAVERVPKESTDLSRTGNIKRDRGGTNTVVITFRGPYARYIHENLTFKHPHGGEAKFLETAMLTKGEAAINKAGEHLWERL